MNKGLVFDGENFEVKTWENESYDFLSENVGGYIEHICAPVLEKRKIDMWCNEEGKLIGLDPTIALERENKVVDVVVGPVVFTRYNNAGETLSLVDGDVEYIKKVLLDKVAISSEGAIAVLSLDV